MISSGRQYTLIRVILLQNKTFQEFFFSFLPFSYSLKIQLLESEQEMEGQKETSLRKIYCPK